MIIACIKRQVARLGWATGLLSAFVPGALGATAPIVLENQRELFVDRYLLEKFEQTELRLATPMSAGKALAFDRPWEGPFSLAGTVYKEGNKFRMFYRGLGGPGETICYAESDDGQTWRRPKLDLLHDERWPENNAFALSAGPRDLDRFSQLGSYTVLWDNRPSVPARERFKAVRMRGDVRGHGLEVIVSPDGFHWEPFTKDPAAKPIAVDYALDTANLITWVPADNCYAIYMRGWTGDKPGVTPPEPNEMGKVAPFFHGKRTIMRSVSTDLIHWTSPQMMSFGDTPREHLYTISAQPYFRAPQIVIAMPMRFDVEGQVLTEEQLKANGISPKMWKGISDAVFISSRGGNTFDRTFIEAFVRPGPEPKNWAARSQIIALGVVQTGPTEMSFYVNRCYGTKEAYAERMTLRLDGFASLHAMRRGGSATTRPVQLRGETMVLNYATAPAGFVKVVLLDEAGKELPGFGEADAVALRGDRIDAPVQWKHDRGIAELKGRAVRIKFLAQDADLYSFGVFARPP